MVKKGHEKVLNIANYSTGEMQIKTTVISHRSEWPSSKTSQIINAREGVEKMEPFYIAGGNVNLYSRYGEHYGLSLKN